MSHQAGRPSPNGPIFKEPNNLDVIYVPSEHEILNTADIRITGQYAVCVSDNYLPGVSAEEKDYMVEFFGPIQQIMENDSLELEPFRDFMGNIIHRIDPTVPHQSIKIWVTANLNEPALLLRSDRQFVDVFLQLADLFRRDPLRNSVLYFFVEFDPYSGVVSENTPQHAPVPHRPYAPPPFLRDQEVNHYVAAGGVSPQHIPTTPTGYEPTSYEPTGHEPTGHELTGSGPSRGPVTPQQRSPSREDTPIPPPTPPHRAKTMEAASKAVSKLVIAVKNVPGTVKDLVSPRAPQEQPTVLTELATRIDQEDYLTSLLPKTNGRPEHQAIIDAYQVEQFERFARYFPDIDPKQRENKRSIRFPHTDLAVTPHQFTRAMEILFQSHSSGGLLDGGILASAMGTGKSIILLCSVAVRALLFESERKVRREWSEVDSRESALKRGQNVRPIHLDHLPRNAPKGRGLKCPTQSQRPWGCHCFCAPDGLTRNELSRLKRGPALIQVPSTSMPGWIEMLESARFSRLGYNFQVLYSGVGGLSSRLQPSPNFGKGFAGSVMGAVLPENHPGGFVDRPQDLTWIVQPAPPSNRSFMAMETYIIVTCHNSPQLRDLFSWHVSDLSPAPQNAEFPPQGLPAFCVGLNLIDEAHKVLEGDRMTLFMAGVNRKVLPTPQATSVGDIWLISGTPFGGKLEDLMTAVSYFAPDRAGEATALRQAYEAIQPAMPNSPEFEALFSNVFGGRLTIRDDRDTTFMGSRITDLQNVRPQYISRETPQSQLHSVRMLLDTKAVTVAPPEGYFDMIKRMKQNTQLLYLLAMFPSAAKVLLESPATAFTDLDTRRMIRKEKNTTGESLTANKTFRSLAEKISRSPRSPKLVYILEELDRMEKDHTPRPQASKSAASAHIQDDPALKKMVIITPTVFTAVLLYIILARYHSKSGPLLYHQDLKQSQRADVLRRFNSLRKRDGPWRVLIAPASVASEALNLQVANRLILTSPLLDAHQERQALARVNRIGQPFDVQLKILLLEDSPVDRIVIAHRANATLQSNPFNVEEDVKVISLGDDSGSTLVG